MDLGRTPSQTVGPFFELGLLRSRQNEPVSRATPGATRITGHVLDGAGEPVPDAVVESWQADASGSYEHGIFARCGTDADGRYELVTVKPGAVGLQAPHIELAVFARGLLRQVVTRIYFPDEQAANARDPVLASLESDDQRATLVAVAEDGALRFDVRLQGDGQTVFFAV
jgi:protocatechuate 3,4-dioxygenase, alpha subunit